MIETIYSSENGDAGRAGKVPTSFKMPKNIRQVGKSNSIKKIYVEDYVMTFIKQLAGGDFSGCKIAVLVGQSIRLENCRNIFISGAVEVRDLDTTQDIIFSNDIWNSIYEDIKKYFVDAEIVGWFLGGPGYLLEDEEKILKIHVDNFAGQDKTLLTYDNMEREEAFYSYENNRLCRQEGYYIYYEKNEEMQTYMIDHKKELTSSEASYDDKVSRDIRTVLQNKKPEEDNRSVTRLMYAAGTMLAVIILVVGAVILRNYDQMKSMQATMDSLSRNMEQIQSMFTGDKGQAAEDTAEDVSDDSKDTADKDGESLDINVVPGDVQPVDNADSQANEAGNDNNGNEINDISDEELAGEEQPNEDAQASEADTNQQTDNAPAVDEVKYYTVVAGDTLADISFKLYNTYTKVDTIMELNDIEDQDVIFVGQKLIVP